MAGKKPLHSKVLPKNFPKTSGKLPASIHQLKSKNNSNNGMALRPRRFSLIYSSDSSLSDVSESEQHNSKLKRKSHNGHDSGNHKHSGDEHRNDVSRKKGTSEILMKNPLSNINNNKKKQNDNSMGKSSKLIRNGSTHDGIGTNDHDEDTGMSENQEFNSGNDEVMDDSDRDDSDSDSDSESDNDSDTSSEDDNIDFVKLTAQRKKRAMKALSTMGRVGDTSPIKSQTKSPKTAASPEVAILQKSPIENKSAVNNIDEDIGEEVEEDSDHEETQRKSVSGASNIKQKVHAPVFSDTEESDYDIDQEAYFNAVEGSDNEDFDLDTAFDTGEDETPLLEQEERMIMQELRERGDVSSINSENELSSTNELDGTRKNQKNMSNLNNGADDDDEDDDNDDEFDMPFYEDPKFANLYYYEDGIEPKLNLSTSLPLLLNDEKASKLRKNQAKKLERKERLKRRELLNKTGKITKKATKTPSLDSDDEYIFGLFFHSDEESHDDRSMFPFKKKVAKIEDIDRKQKMNLISPLRHLDHRSKTQSDYDDSDKIDENILLNEAHIPSDEDSEHGSVTKSPNLELKQIVSKDGHVSKSSTNHNDDIRDGNSSNEDKSEFYSLDDDDDDDDDDDMSLTNVFIDIDDLDPDSFYFHYDDEEDEDIYNYNTDDSSVDPISNQSTLNSSNSNRKIDGKADAMYIDDDSTDEDDNLPPTTSKSKSITTKAKEVVGSNVVGLRPPKLGTWETNSKPFTIIDGLSTKSLYPLIQEHRLLQEQKASSQPLESRNSEDSGSGNGDELTLNELLNMSELEDGEDDTDFQKESSATGSVWYENPRVPLSAFRNKGVHSIDDEDYLVALNSIKKLPIGYVGNERTRRKIDKMKELQRKEHEKRRKLKKKKKLLKIRRAKERQEKEHLIQETANSPIETKLFNLSNAASPSPTKSRHNSIKSMGLEEINEILGKDEPDLLDIHQNTNLEDQDQVLAIDDAAFLDDKDVDILASLTAPVPLNNFNGSEASLWRRRQSIAEAAEENMRLTKSGLFSESALADIEGILGEGITSNTFEFSEVLQ